MAGNVPLRHTKSATDLRGTLKRGYKRLGTDARYWNVKWYKRTKAALQ